mgnify:FL=1
MRFFKHLATFAMVCCLTLNARSQQSNTFVPSEHGLIKSDREDGRFISSRRVLQAMLKHTEPKYAFKPTFSPAEFKKWQTGLRQAMKDIMFHPNIKNQPVPKLLKSEPRKGYTIEKWEFYPLPECVSTFLVMIPDNLQKKYRE